MFRFEFSTTSYFFLSFVSFFYGGGGGGGLGFCLKNLRSFHFCLFVVTLVVFVYFLEKHLLHLVRFFLYSVE